MDNLNNLNCCFFCLKPLPGCCKTPRKKKKVRNFFLMVQRHFGASFSFSFDQLQGAKKVKNKFDYGDVWPCSECLSVLETFNELYDQLRNIELRTNMVLSKIGDIIKNASKESINRKKCRDNQQNFLSHQKNIESSKLTMYQLKARQKLLTKCSNHLTKQFPIVTVKRCKLPLISKSCNNKLTLDLNATIKQEYCDDMKSSRHLTTDLENGSITILLVMTSLKIVLELSLVNTAGFWNVTDLPNFEEQLNFQKNRVRNILLDMTSLKIVFMLVFVNSKNSHQNQKRYCSEAAEIPIDDDDKQNQCKNVITAKSIKDVSNCDTLSRKCVKIRDSKQLLRKHEYTRSDKSIRPRCPVCEKRFTVKYNMYVHMIKCHPSDPMTKIKMSQLGWEKRLGRYGRRKENNKVFSNQETAPVSLIAGDHQPNWQKMKRRHVSKIKKFVCQKCGKDCRTEPSYRYHMQTHLSPDNWKYSCSICGKRFIVKVNLDSHMKAHKKDKSLPCPNNKGLETNHSLSGAAAIPIDTKVHPKTAENEETSKSGADFGPSSDTHLKTRKSKQLLRKHEYTRCDESTWPRCPVCEKRFIVKQNLYVHMKKMHPNDPSTKSKMNQLGWRKRQMSRCKKRKENRKRISSNKQIGRQKKTYVCQKCGKDWGTCQAYRYHKQTHLSPENWKYFCSVCGKRFILKTGRDSHMKTHTKETPLPCPNNLETNWPFEASIEMKVNSESDKVKTCLERHQGESVTCDGINSCSSLNECSQICITMDCTQPFDNETNKLSDGLQCDTPTQKCLEMPNLKQRLRIRRHPNSDGSTKPYSCPVCETPFMVKQNMFVHMIKMHPNDPLTKSKMLQLGWGQRLMSRSKKQIENGDFPKNEQVAPQKKKYVCQKCGKHCRTHQSYGYHIRTHLSPQNWKYFCSVCGKRFILKNSRDSHMKTHTKETPLQCPNNVFLETDQILDAAKIPIDTKVHPEIENIKTGDGVTGDLNEHDQSCKSENGGQPSIAKLPTEMFKCHRCHQAFDTFSTLKYHWLRCDSKEIMPSSLQAKADKLVILAKERRKVADNKRQGISNRYKFKCTKCSKFFISKQQYEYHQLTHSDISTWPHSCSVCDKRFIAKAGLESHMRTHTKEKPFACPKCDKKFAHHCTIKRHMKICQKPVSTTDDQTEITVSQLEVRKQRRELQNFICQKCGKDCQNHQRYRYHMQTHLNPECWKFSCSFCEKRFITKSSLDIHMRTHTKEKIFECLKCDRKFGTYTGRKYHMKTYHHHV